MFGSIISPRLRSAITYLHLYADAPNRWRIGKGQCPLCGPSVFLALKASPFMTRCLKCSSNVTNLALVPVVKKHFNGQVSGRSAYELSTFGATLKWLGRNFGQVASSEYFPGQPTGIMIQGVLNQDVQRLTFLDESFDVVTSNQVFEHVPDDVQGYRECLRVLKPGGALVFSVPLRDLPATVAKAYIEDGVPKIIGEPEYHDSRLGGRASALCFWHHSSRDITRRVKSSGFSSAELVDVIISEVQGVPEQVIYAVK